MKQVITFSRSLWDASTGTMVPRDFVLTINTDKIPVGPLHKSRKNKGGLSKAFSGAVTIRPAKEDAQ